MGDDITTKQPPLINIIVSGSNLAVVLLEVIDCSGHMAAGGKSMPHIFQTLPPHLLNPDPLKKLKYVVFLYCASNAQTCGKKLAAKYPRITVLHGFENCISLLFSDIKNIPDINTLPNKTKKIYLVFRLVSFRGNFSRFSFHSNITNNGIIVGLSHK